ncbi:hypothetical protein [Noviherbaspirillum soli]|uniref:hypothetical protein n=1 Tax=Noviherbaspirillum soli TaxID=1064518 RepID=UPI00188B994D|nr:hypothetical protein [Noviherbaspirillum soli]
MSNATRTVVRNVSQMPASYRPVAYAPVADNLLLTMYAAIKLVRLFQRPERTKRAGCWAAVQRRNSAPLKRPASTRPEVRGYSASAWLARHGRSALQFVRAGLEPSVQLARLTAQTGAQGLERAVAALESADNWLWSWMPGLPGAAAESQGWRRCFRYHRVIESVSPQPGCEWTAQAIVDIMQHLGFEVQVLGGRNISDMSLENMTLIGPQYMEACMLSACPELPWNSRMILYRVLRELDYWRAAVWAPGDGWSVSSPEFSVFEWLGEWMSRRLPPPNNQTAIVEVMYDEVSLTALAEARWQPAIVLTYPWSGLPPWEIAAAPTLAFPDPTPAPMPVPVPHTSPVLSPALQPSPANPAAATGPGEEGHSRMPLALMGSGMAVCLVIAAGAVTGAYCYVKKSGEAMAGGNSGDDKAAEPKVQPHPSDSHRSGSHRSSSHNARVDVTTIVQIPEARADRGRLSGGEDCGRASGNDADNA